MYIMLNRSVCIVLLYMFAVKSFDFDVEEDYMRHWTAMNVPIVDAIPTPIDPTTTPTPNIFILFPGVGFHEDRIKIVLNNLKILNKSRGLSTFACLMFAYRTPIPHIRSEIERYCDIEMYFHANFASYMKAAVPTLLEMAGYSHVMVLLDDIQLPYTFRLNHILNIMDRNNLSVISPSILGATYSATTCMFCKPRLRSEDAQIMKAPQVGHRVDVIEIFATVFTLSAWKCWWTLLQPTLNSIGWGYDRCLKKHCRTTNEDFALGIVTNVIAIHATDRIVYIDPTDKNQGVSNPFAQLQSWLNVTNSYSLYENEVAIGDYLV